jgi:hypothetical protein
MDGSAMPKKYSISIFQSQWDITPEDAHLTWDELKTLFGRFATTDSDKRYELHFNGCEYKKDGIRRQDDAEALHVLVLDFDDGITIQQAKEHFSQYRHLGYTSHNHQYDKHGDGRTVDKFRILLPLKKPCPKHIWMKIRHNVETFAPSVDMSSVKLSQPFAIPLQRKRFQGENWTNVGEELDWSDWPELQPNSQRYIAGDPSNKSDRTLCLDDVVHTKKGNIEVGDIDRTKPGIISGVLCPFHDDKKPGEHIRVLENGSGFLSCHKCGTIWIKDESSDFIENLIEKANARKRKSYKQKMVEKFKEEKANAELSDDALKNCVTPGDLLSFDGSKAYEPYSRERRGEILRKAYKATENRVLLYAAEGFGKSFLANILIKEKGRKVLFACQSNKQVAEQAESFNAQGLKVQTICARDYWLRVNHKVEVEYYDRSHPWDYEDVNDDKTISNMKKMGMSDERVNHLWEQYSPPDPDFENYDLIITTQARVMGWGRKQMSKTIPIFGVGRAGRPKPYLGQAPEKRVVPRDVVIFCDDAQASDFCLLADFDNRYVNFEFSDFFENDVEKLPLVDKKPLEVKNVGKRIYFVRPRSFLFGYGFDDNQVIFSTTELVTSDLILKRFGGRKKKIVGPESGKVNSVGRVYMPELIPPGKMIAGNISMVKTEFVRKKLDGILPVIVERVRKKWENKLEYVADGQGCAVNHVTIKGQNAFSDYDLIIEISYDHMDKIRRILDELEWDNDQAEVLKVAFALDTIHQAIGRNSGYRYTDSPKDARGSSVVLVEPRLFRNVVKLMRYQHTAAIDLDDCSTKLKRDQIGKDFTTTVCWFISNVYEYLSVQGGKSFLSDVTMALRNTGAKSEYPGARHSRLLDSLRTLTERSMGSGRYPTLSQIVAKVEEMDVGK